MDLISEDPQFLFDTAIRKLAEQGHKSRTAFNCAYQHGEDRCAIGWLMTDQAISTLGDSVGSIGRLIENKRFFPGKVSAEFLQDLQSVHDTVCSSHSFRQQALTFAVFHKLNPDIVYQLLTPEWCQDTKWNKQ
jgi:hypothetical protein